MKGKYSSLVIFLAHGKTTATLLNKTGALQTAYQAQKIRELIMTLENQTVEIAGPTPAVYVTTGRILTEYTDTDAYSQTTDLVVPETEEQEIEEKLNPTKFRIGMQKVIDASHTLIVMTSAIGMKLATLFIAEETGELDPAIANRSFNEGDMIVFDRENRKVYYFPAYTLEWSTDVFTD
jgi:hypothetical protein